MTWDYRVTKQSLPGEEHFSIREVYYNKEGEIYACTENPVGVSGDSREELIGDLQHYVEALAKPVLDLDEWEKTMVDYRLTKENE